jgi:hypothetical protein
MNKVYLNVPYAQKDEAKRRGARWDAGMKKWYVLSGTNLTPFQPWLPPTSATATTTATAKLTIELVPSTCWYTNVRSQVSSQDWDRLRQHTYAQAHHRCEVCGGVGPQHPVECHEVWHYDDDRHIQTLVKLIALCPACHEVKHMGFANTQGRGQIAQQHLAKVNRWSLDQTQTYVQECFQVWQRRSQYQWQLDISYLELLLSGSNTDDRH